MAFIRFPCIIYGNTKVHTDKGIQKLSNVFNMGAGTTEFSGKYYVPHYLKYKVFTL